MDFLLIFAEMVLTFSAASNNYVLASLIEKKA